MNRYLYMIGLLDRNERLFYKLLSENIEELMPIVYTPTVGLACQKYGYAFKKPQVSSPYIFQDEGNRFCYNFMICIFIVGKFHCNHFSRDFSSRFMIKDTYTTF